MFKSKLAVWTALSGWTLFITYIIYDIIKQGSSVRHFLEPEETLEFVFHFVMLTLPIGSTITAYLISVRKKLLDKMQQSEIQLKHAVNEWKATFDSLPYGIMLIDREFNIIRANNYISDLCGTAAQDQVFNKKCYKMIHKIDKPAHNCPLLRSLQTGKKETVELYEPGVNKYFMSHIMPVHNEQGSVNAYVHSLIDISYIKENEKKLNHAKNAFFNMLKDIDSAYKDLKGIHDSLIITFSNIIDAKSPWTSGHSSRVADYAVSAARAMGLDDREVETLRTAALLHDIGKIGTYDVILDKPDELDHAEHTLIKQHTIKGEDILRPIKGLKNITTIVRSHHERVDGTGYPDGLKGDQIHTLAKILCVADSYDAMISNRPYRLSQGRDYAMSEIERCSGTQFDPKVSEAFLRILGRNKDNLQTS